MSGEVFEGLGYGLLFWLVIGLGALVVALIAGLQDTNARRKRREAGLKSDFSRVRSRMSRLARPTILLVPTKGPAFSKIGGEPDLPDNAVWPAPRGRCSAFLVQVDLASLPPLGWLSEAGYLFAFVDLEGSGFPDHVVVQRYAEFSEHRADRTGCPTFPERRVMFETYNVPPSLDWLGEDELDLDPDELDLLAEAPDEPFGDELQHRIGGYPSEIQGSQMSVSCELIRRGLPEDAEVTPAILRAAKAWRLLFQIDSDPALKMNWGDGGRLYVFVREQDAKGGDFSKTITLSQSH